MEGSALKCDVCGSVEKLQRCGFCKRAFYCSRDHQVKDWKQHKERCQQIKSANASCSNSTNGASEHDRKTGPKNKLSGAHVNPTLSASKEDKINENFESECNTFDNKTQNRNTIVDQCRKDAEDDNDDGVPFDIRQFRPCKTLTVSPNKSVEQLGKVVVDRLLKDGFCIVDSFFSTKEVDDALENIQECHRTGLLDSGRLAGGKTGDDAKKQVINSGIRSDKIMWVEGNESHIPGISRIVSCMDDILGTFNIYLDGKYFINRRTKAMVACYPGNGSCYKRHVDNPNKDGRVVTCILYLNKEWDVQENGGFLRILPTDTNTYYDVSPQANRLLFFWSDSRNPHEVHPAYKTRYAITVWYMDKIERERAKMETEDTNSVHENQEYNIGDPNSTQNTENEVNKQIEDVATTAISSLSLEELQAISAVIKDQPNPGEVLLQLGISPAIQDKLIDKLKNM